MYLRTSEKPESITSFVFTCLDFVVHMKFSSLVKLIAKNSLSRVFLFFFLTYCILLNLGMAIIPNGDCRKFKPITTVPMCGVVKPVLLDQLLDFMVLTLSFIFVVFVPLSLERFSRGRKWWTKTWGKRPSCLARGLEGSMGHRDTWISNTTPPRRLLLDAW